MNRMWKSSLIIICFAFLPAFCGCGDDNVHPRLDDGIVGQVTDGAGNPVAGAAIGLVFNTQAPDPFAKPSTGLTFDMPDAGHLKVMILNAAGETVRILVDEESPAGNHSVFWDSRVATGDLAPNGPYSMVVEVQQQEIASAYILISNQGVETLFERANATTDAEGYFRIPRDLVPTGVTLPVPIGGELIDQVISLEVTVEAARISGQGTVYVQRTITLPASWEIFTVDISLH